MTLVDELRDRFGVEPVLRVIGVAASTYYGWLTQAANPSARRRKDAELAVEIAEIHDVSGGTYGSPRVHAMLCRQGRRVGRKRVERLMREHGLQGRVPAQEMAHPVDPVEPEGDTGSGSGQTAVHGGGAEPPVGRRRHPDPLRAGRVLARRGATCSPTASWAGGAPTAATPT
ncbi:IS3 family transposase [Micromonospora aurantiaca]|uniref:IS3 family transposase n=1 Tax=Micromonospora aurantiaca (nom. illeg.) TaxID=47850 RepID=UPI001E39DA17|nr:IS3 family transposase [Micromonospora aurantiaca]UFN96254.1 IS3 family transposase [Micromonospora aurantiaca]